MSNKLPNKNQLTRQFLILPQQDYKRVDHSWVRVLRELLVCPSFTLNQKERNLRLLGKVKTLHTPASLPAGFLSDVGEEKILF